MSQAPAFPVPKLLRLLYVHNPFYLISACLFVYGLKAFFRPDNMDFLYAAGSVDYIDPWWLMGSLCGVTVLMASTAYLIVRFGKVWEDARSLVLVLLLMFLAISVSFDEIITLVSFREGQNWQAIALMVFGGVFSIATSETLLRGLKIRLPLEYRVPFYGLLALFFAFPMWVCPQVSAATPEEARWRVALFPTLAASLSLALLPAIRRGRQFVQDNGTPWSWPMFPWTLFVFLGGAVLFRSYSLAISFDRADARADFWDSSFGLYFLVPFVLAAIVVLLEIALVEGFLELRNQLLKLAPLTLLLSYPWVGPWTRHVTYARFAYEFIEVVASPVYLTLLALLAFYAVAWWRGLQKSELGVFGCLALLVFIGPRSFGATTFELTREQLHVWPLGVLGAIEVGFGLYRRKSLATLIGAVALSLGVGILLIDSPLQNWKASITYHLIVLSTLTIGIVFHDEFARWLRAVASWLLLVSGSFCLAYVTTRTLTLEIFMYSAGVAVVALTAHWLERDWRFIVGAALSLSSTPLFALRRAYQTAQQTTIPAGVKPLIWAVLCFATAVLISMLKGGLQLRLVKRSTAALAAASERDSIEEVPRDT